MRWEDERYVRLYTRDTAEFLAMSWQARGLFALLLRKVDRAGILALGRLGLRGVAVVVGGPWGDIEGPLAELLEDGCVVHVEEPKAVLHVPGFMAAQDAPQSDAARKRASRERAASDAAAANVTKRDLQSQNVTKSHARSRLVTSGHSVPSQAYPSQAKKKNAASAASEPDGSGSPSVGEGDDLRAPAVDPARPEAPDSPPSGPRPPPPQLALVPTEPPKPSPVATVFAGYVAGSRLHGKRRTPILTAARTRLIAARLKEFEPEMLALAARGIWLSGWNVDEGRTDLELAIRDAGHVERFAALAERGELVPRSSGAKPVLHQREPPEGRAWTTPQERGEAS